MKLPPAPKATPPARPTNALHTVANAVNSVVGAPMQAVNLLNEGFASATSSISKALPSFPAAKLMSLALGTPHAHVAHPPSGPPPVPPTPLPPFGPVTLGTCVSVLINGMPAARCGDLGLGPTCCGIPPIYEVFTGSSNVFIGGSRAARSMDITYHCKPVPPAGAATRGTVAATRTAMNMAMKAAAMAAKVAGAASQVAQVASIAGDAIEAVESDDAAMSAALGMSAGMAAAQMAADAIAMAMGNAMGKDVCVPPGTPGMITMGSPNVLIGGFPMPSWSDIAKGMLKFVKGLKKRAGAWISKKFCWQLGEPVDVVTGANLDEFVDFQPANTSLFVWKRYYDSRWSDRPGPMGRGFRHEYEREFRRTLDGFTYVGPDGDVVDFPALDEEDPEIARDGYVLRGVSPAAFEIDEPGGLTMEFALREGASTAALKAVRSESARLHFMYDSAGRLFEVSAPLGRRLGFEYTPEGLLKELRLMEPSGPPRGTAIASYEYDTAARMSSWCDALRNRARYEYDSGGRMSKKTDRRGYSFHYRYDTQGRCVHTRGDDGLYDVSFTYDPAARTTKATFSDGASWTFLYDERGAVTRVLDPGGGVTLIQVDEQGVVRQEVDPSGNVTTLTYDENGGVTGRIDPLGFALPPPHVEPNPPDPLEYELPETPVEWELGALVDPTEAESATPHDPVLDGLAEDVRDFVLGLGGAEASSKEASSGNGPVYDAMDQLSQDFDAEGRARQWTHDPNGNVLTYRDRDGSVEANSYISWNLLQQTVDGIGGTTRFEYSSREELTRVRDPGGTVSEYVYDQKDRLAEVRRHGQIKERYRYDPSDNLVEKADGSGKPLLTFEVGRGNLHASRRLASGETQSFRHDDRGNIVVAACERSTSTFAYDARGRLVKDERDGLGVVHEFKGRDAPTATTVLGRFTTRRQWLDENTLQVRDPTGAIHRIRLGRRGIVLREFSNGSRELARHDATGRWLEKVLLAGSSAGRTWRRRYRYSGEGDLESALDGDTGTTTYEHDAAHRLRSERLQGQEPRVFDRDPAGNVLRMPGLSGVVVDPGNRLRSANGDSFAYDRRDNLAGRDGPSGRARYEYDSLDRLIRCRIGEEEWSAEYDPLCRRTQKTWKGQTTQFYWDDFRLAAEISSRDRLRIYVYADHVALVPLLFVEYANRDAEPSTGSCYFILTNQIGCPERVEDSRGVTVWKGRCDPYGTLRVSDDSTTEMPLRFPGHYFDPETQLHYNRFRYYSPALGRYLESDPIGIEGGLNLYAYAPSPVSDVDLDGLVHSRQRASKKRGKSKAKSVRESIGKKKRRQSKTYRLKLGTNTYTINRRTGLTVRAEGIISGSHPGRKKGYRPEPLGGRATGHHRGHLIPEGGVDKPADVNVRQNIISESSSSNLSAKKKLENQAIKLADDNPSSEVKLVSKPHYPPGETVPDYVTHDIVQDGKVVHSESIPNV
jgi:RHS repeat-associated protein